MSHKNYLRASLERMADELAEPFAGLSEPRRQVIAGACLAYAETMGDVTADTFPEGSEERTNALADHWGARQILGSLMSAHLTAKALDHLDVDMPEDEQDNLVAFIVALSQLGSKPAPVAALEVSPAGPKWGHAASEHTERWSGSFTSREEAIADGLATYDGDEFWIQAGAAVQVESLLPGTTWITEHMAERANDEVGEACGDYPNVSDAGKADLRAGLAAWARKHAPVTFWQPVGDSEKIEASVLVTLEDEHGEPVPDAVAVEAVS